MREARITVADYQMIRFHAFEGEHRNLWPSDTAEWNARSLVWLQCNLDRSQSPAVVVVHHGPSGRCHDIGRWGAPDPTSVSFWSNLEDLIQPATAKLWVYGHTHANIRFAVNAVPVVTNQRGYIDEDPGVRDFDPGYTIEIPG